MASIGIKLLSLFLLLSLSGKFVEAQQLRHPFSENMQFIQFLQDKNQFNDAILAIDEISFTHLNQAQKDSLNYFKGWAYYNIKSLDSSAHFLLNVQPQSVFYLKSRFFGAYNLTYLGHYDHAKKTLNNTPTHENITELKDYEQSGIALFNNNFEAFDSLKQNFSFNHYAFAGQEKNIITYRDQLSGIKRKSPVLAGIMSAIIPGIGKIYAGKTYQGFGSMLPIAALGLLTYESYHKKGFKSVPFYIFGSLFAIYYVGNIWGSVFAVKITQEEHEKLIHQKILLDLQIPLRTIFN